MAKIPYNVDAYTARLIGRENLSKVDSAVVELVKNTYDADADICILYVDREEKKIYLCDNGTGMTKDIIEEHWMTIGHSSKVKKYKTYKGRIQTGSKGIGRFALDRIARKSIMYTCTEDSKLILKQDWTKFEPNKKITDIYAEIDEVDIDIDTFCKDIKNDSVKKLIMENFLTGTVFQMSELEEEWDIDLFERIKKTLISIASPDLEGIFKIYLFDNNTNIDDARIRSNLINQYDYKLDFKINKNGYANIIINRNEFNLPDDFSDVLNVDKEVRESIDTNIININKPLDEIVAVDLESLKQIGVFSGTLYFLKTSSTSQDREKFMYKDITGRVNPTKKFGGIKIYRDNFKVRPYGDLGSYSFDWLMLSARKTSSPAAISHTKGRWRVRGEQMIGQINISRTNLKLADQANREGIVETKEFNLFRDVILEIISLFEKDRQDMVMRAMEYNSLKYPKVRNEKVVKEFLNNDKKEEKNKDYYNNKYYDEIRPAIKAIIDEKDDKINTLENEISMLTTLATTGIVTNTYIHELRGFSTKLFTEICTAKEMLQFVEEDYKGKKDISSDIKELKEVIDESYQYNGIFNSWFGVTIGSVSKDRRKMKKQNIYNILNKQILGWNKVLESKGIELEFAGEENIEVRCFSYELDSIISNLITNSVSAFESDRNINNNNKINIVLESGTEGFIIKYRDNGPGLINTYKSNPEKIFEAFESNKRNLLGEKFGTGMGMWIVKRNVDLYKGSIDLKKNTDTNNGFYADIRIKGRRN